MTSNPNPTPDTPDTPEYSLDNPQVMPHGKPSPVLLIFLLFPLVGLVAAIGIALSNGIRGASSGGVNVITATDVIPTPGAVTLPPIPSPAPVVGAPMLDFELPALDGELVSLSQYSGRIVFLNFWATWCEPCKRELPALEAFAAEQGDEGAAVITVNSGESLEQVQAFLEEFGVDALTVLIDGDTAVTNTYGVFQIPVTYVIDANGNVRYPHYGEITRDDMLGYMMALTQ
ncbi:MAG: TlpA family protein disulfide reductase [Pleurocapsa minor GSE-CHR-MK-17-07R]|jgi:peroxiredoxin|nr:TlpA family protein disulfide reductase [Pleurocapsa minor GSE-CHR-MK 17-07R]